MVCLDVRGGRRTGLTCCELTPFSVLCFWIHHLREELPKEPNLNEGLSALGEKTPQHSRSHRGIDVSENGLTHPATTSGNRPDGMIARVVLKCHEASNEKKSCHCSSQPTAPIRKESFYVFSHSQLPSYSTRGVGRLTRDTRRDVTHVLVQPERMLVMLYTAGPPRFVLGLSRSLLSSATKIDRPIRT